MQAQFSTVQAMASDGTNLYLTGSTTGNNRVRVVRPVDPAWFGMEDPLVAAGGALMHPIPAVAQERDYLSSPLAQVSPIGKRVASANLTGGKLSSLQFQ